jgi:hypothetical protein
MYRHSLRCDHCFRSPKPQLPPRRSQSVFSGLAARPVALSSKSPSLLRVGNVLFSPTLSAVDACQPKHLVQHCQCPFSVQIEFSRAVRHGPQSIELSMLDEWSVTFFLFFHSIVHRARQLGRPARGPKILWCECEQQTPARRLPGKSLTCCDRTRRSCWL